ncbi:hypothetical protein ACFL35_15570 [Candidatus Riflebacteria bacterium]
MKKARNATALEKEGVDESTVYQALLDLYFWTLEHHLEFYDQGDTRPTTGWVGKWGDGCFAYIHRRFKKIMEEKGYVDSREIIEQWRKMGLLEQGIDKNRLTKRLRIDGYPEWVIVLNQAKVSRLTLDLITDIYARQHSHSKTA